MTVRKHKPRKADATRARLLERALKLFQKRGIAATTMRDIAKAAGMSLGAAYYYFPSKDALIFAYYEDNQADAERIAAAATGTPRVRIGAILHGKLESIRPYRKMLGAIVQRLIDPSDPLSAFSAPSRGFRERGIALFVPPLRDAGLAEGEAELAAGALWLFLLAAMLVYVSDDSPGERRTHGLVDHTLDLVMPLLPMLATPVGKAIVDRVSGALHEAGLV